MKHKQAYQHQNRGRRNIAFYALPILFLLSYVLTTRVGASVPDERLIATAESVAAEHFIYARFYNGLPIFDGDVRVHIDKQTGERMEDITGIDPVEIGQGDGYYNGRLVRRVEVRDEYGRPSIIYSAVNSDDVWVEPRWYDVAGEVGRGRVFIPNPIVATGDFSLTDQDDIASAVPPEAYTIVSLDNLDGSGYLDGTFVNTRLIYGANTRNRISSPSLDFTRVNRSSVGFEEVQVYWALNEAATYIHTLGFPNVMNYSLSTDPYTVQIEEDNPAEVKNAFFLPYTDNGTGEIVFGTQGVDAGEDSDVAWHEYGHAILNHQGHFKNQAIDGFGEGFGDWFAAVMSVKMGYPEAAPCIAEWFSVDMPEAERDGPCLRSLENDRHYPEDMVTIHRPGYSDVIDTHASSLIISGALWEATKQMDVDTLVRIVLEGNFNLSGTPRQPEAAQKYIEAAHRLGYDSEAELLTIIFRQRGLIQ